MTDASEQDVTRRQPATPGPADATPAQAEETTPADSTAQAEETTSDAAAPGADAPAADADAPAETRLDPVAPDEVTGQAGDPPASPARGAGIPVGFRGEELNGRLLGNRYRLDERIAVGGMGQVWRATDQALGRPVAVKLLSAKHAAQDQFRARFRAEARYAASLSHPGIAQVYDYGESDQVSAGRDADPDTGLPYLVMELVEGEPLSAAIARDAPLPVPVTLDLVAQAARALAVAHAAGIVHRDIKPGNLLITPEGQVKITDFGIARAAVAAHLTLTGMVMGTAQYVSPEQASAHEVTAAADIYSLGVVAYECLAGHPPFTAEAPIALALAHVHEPPPPLPGDVPPPVAALIGQMLAKEPADRPASAQAVATRATALKNTPAALQASSTGRVDPWVIASGEPDNPSRWFSDPAPTRADDGPADPAHGASPAAASPGQGAGPAHGGQSTAPITGVVAARPARTRRLVVRVVAAAAVIMAATAGSIAALTSGNHPTPPTTTGDRGASHRPAPPRSHSPVPALGGDGSFTPTPSYSSPSTAVTRRASPIPTTGSPSTSPSPTSSPTSTGSPTGTPTPTSTPTGSPSPTTTPTTQGQLPIAGPQTPKITTQDG